jgi:hypothetical protein
MDGEELPKKQKHLSSSQNDTLSAEKMCIKHSQVGSKKDSINVGVFYKFVEALVQFQGEKLQMRIICTKSPILPRNANLYAHNIIYDLQII